MWLWGAPPPPPLWWAWTAYVWANPPPPPPPVAALVAVVLLLLLLLRLNSSSRKRDDLGGALVVITGAAGGLGRELAAEFAAQGARIALWDVREAALEGTKAWLVETKGAPPDSISARVVDVGSAEAVAKAAAEQHALLGAPRAVVSAAAAVCGQTVLDADVERLRAAFAVNAMAPFWLAKSFLPQMTEGGRGGGGGEPGTLVTVGSVMGELPGAQLADYCGAKAAVSQLHECLRVELRGAVNLLHVVPYAIDTPLFAGGAPWRYGWMRALVPPLRPEAVARSVVLGVQTRQERLVLPWVRRRAL
jgi:NAD(P)-dependent dehydrogenase (short-subunit alcohol dehydrogenase family)